LPKKKTATPFQLCMLYTKISLPSIIQKQAYIFCHSLDGKNNISEIEQLLQSRNIASYKFSKEGEGFSNLTDEEFKHNVALAKNIVFVVMYFNWFYHVYQSFKGDEFNVYRGVAKHHRHHFLIMVSKFGSS
jgi:anthranilate synthase component 1